MDGRTHLSVDVLDELVEILEPFVGVLILKIAAHRHDGVVGRVTGGLSKRFHDLGVNGFDITSLWLFLKLQTTPFSYIVRGLIVPLTGVISVCAQFYLRWRVTSCTFLSTSVSIPDDEQL